MGSYLQVNLGFFTKSLTGKAQGMGKYKLIPDKLLTNGIKINEDGGINTTGWGSAIAC